MVMDLLCTALATTTERYSNFSLLYHAYLHHIVCYRAFTQLGAGLAVGISGLAAGYAIGVVGDSGVRGTAQQPR